MIKKNDKKNLLIAGSSSSLAKSFLKYSNCKNLDIYIFDRSHNRLKKHSTIKSENCTFEFSKISFSYFINFATVYGRSNESMSEMFSCNVGYPLDIIFKINKTKKFTFINIGTALNPGLNFYSFSKSIVKKIFVQTELVKDVKYIELELQHFYGEFDKPDKFFNFLYNKLISKTPFEIKNPSSLREFVHVEDVVSAINLVINNSNVIKSLETIYIGTQEPIEIKKIVEIFCKEMNFPINLVKFNNKVNLNINDKTKFTKTLDPLKKLGWRKKFNVKKGIKDYLRKKIKNKNHLSTN